MRCRHSRAGLRHGVGEYIVLAGFEAIWDSSQLRAGVLRQCHGQVRVGPRTLCAAETLCSAAAARCSATTPRGSPRAPLGSWRIQRTVLCRACWSLTAEPVRPLRRALARKDASFVATWHTDLGTSHVLFLEFYRPSSCCVTATLLARANQRVHLDRARWSGAPFHRVARPCFSAGFAVRSVTCCPQTRRDFLRGSRTGRQPKAPLVLRRLSPSRQASPPEPPRVAESHCCAAASSRCAAGNAAALRSAAAPPKQQLATESHRWFTNNCHGDAVHLPGL